MKNNNIRPGVSILAEEGEVEAATSLSQNPYGGVYPQGGMTEMTNVAGAPVAGVTGPTEWAGGQAVGVTETTEGVGFGGTLPTEPVWGSGAGIVGGIPRPPVGGNDQGVAGVMGGGMVPPPSGDDEETGTELDVKCCVGWLMVVKGPELGVSKELHPCWNNIGRSTKADVCIHGDSKISGLQVRVNYVEQLNKYYIVPHGDSSQNTIVNGAPLLSSQELKHGDIIDLSKETQLRFIPACDAKFVWCPAGEEKSWRTWEEADQ